MKTGRDNVTVRFLFVLIRVIRGWNIIWGAKT